MKVFEFYFILVWNLFVTIYNYHFLLFFGHFDKKYGGIRSFKIMFGLLYLCVSWYLKSINTDIFQNYLLNTILWIICLLSNNSFRSICNPLSSSFYTFIHILHFILFPNVKLCIRSVTWMQHFFFGVSEFCSKVFLVLCGTKPKFLKRTNHFRKNLADIKPN